MSSGFARREAFCVVWAVRKIGLVTRTVEDTTKAKGGGERQNGKGTYLGMDRHVFCSKSVL